MSAEIECRKCGNNLEQWNNGQYLWIKYCPQCGTRLLKKQSEALHRKTTVEEISDMIRERLLGVLSCRDGRDIRADELAVLVWDRESCDGVVFYANYQADLFAMRHMAWVDKALKYIGNRIGNVGHYTKMKAECNDRFLVSVFIYATEHYVFDQLGIDCDRGVLTKRQIGKIKRLVKATGYDGEF
jgi:DNA-directed RNA polymerase subunit RPC12/RpoP